MRIMNMCKLSVLAIAAFSGAMAFGAKDSPISVFGFQLMDYAKAQKITVDEAAARFRAAGVTGFDCDYADAFVPELVKAGMKPVNFYVDMKFFVADNGAKQADEVLAAAEKWKVKLVMALPDEFTGTDDEGEFAKIVSGFRVLVQKAAAKGITVTTEDYGWHRPGKVNACGQSKWILRLLKECPGLKFTVDTGNLMYTEGQDAILPLALATTDLTVHCHLKDLVMGSSGQAKYRTLGKGAVANAEVVRNLEAHGYRGWYTLENLVGDDLLADAREQVRVLNGWR